jgi:outer membrane protein TolC
VITASIALNGARDLVIDARTAFHLARVSLVSATGQRRFAALNFTLFSRTEP